MYKIDACSCKRPKILMSWFLVLLLFAFEFISLRCKDATKTLNEIFQHFLPSKANRIMTILFRAIRWDYFSHRFFVIFKSVVPRFPSCSSCFAFTECESSTKWMWCYTFSSYLLFLVSFTCSYMWKPGLGEQEKKNLLLVFLWKPQIIMLSGAKYFSLLWPAAVPPVPSPCKPRGPRFSSPQ